MIGNGDEFGSFLHLCRAVAKYGSIDPSRSDARVEDDPNQSFQRRFHFAAAGQSGITLV